MPGREGDNVRVKSDREISAHTRSRTPRLKSAIAFLSRQPWEAVHSTQGDAGSFFARDMSGVLHFDMRRADTPGTVRDRHASRPPSFQSSPRERILESGARIRTLKPGHGL